MFRLIVLFYLTSNFLFALEPISYKHDDSKSIAINHRVKNSHLKVYMPTLPYFNILSLINGTLVRLSDSNKGWEYYLAYKHKKIDDLTYDFWLRKNVKYQDGSKFDADSVVENFKHFMKGPFYTVIYTML